MGSARWYTPAAGRAVLSTSPPTVDTAASALAIRVALLVRGDTTLADIALMLLIGVLARTATTVAVAVLLEITLEARWPASPAGHP